MNAEDYQKVKEIFNSVLEIEPDGRSAFLDEKCDEPLRHEVERLLGSYDSEYLEQPAVGNAAEDIVGEGLKTGQKIGHYTIVEKIGSGGMGEVYLAEDGKLGRRVAIKLLPDVFTKDEDRLRRFDQEARTASALNHPNILTIHEIGETDSTKYIATEYIDGETLRQKLNRERLTAADAMEIAVQTASALAAAHEAGIIHRDIKPENIMLRQDNLVKVLDFGLAKLAEKQNVSVSHDAKTEKHLRTAPGMIMGTVQYMSPEQARSHATDARTDIWSLGVVIYEMLAGRPPFKGENSADLIAEIVKTHPAPLSHFADEIPERLDEIVAKTLEKNPDERYQTAKDLLIDLKRLKRKLDLEAEVERSHSPATQSGRASLDSSDEAKTVVTAQETAETETRSKNTVSSAEYLVSGIWQHKKAAVATMLIGLFLVGGAGLAAWYTGIIFAPSIQPEPFDSHEISRITFTGKASSPALSSDGKFIAFVNSEVLEHTIVIRQVATGADVNVVKPQHASYLGELKFTSDGNYLYYTVVTGIVGSLFKVPSLGGTPVKIADDIDLGLTFSPDGSRLAFVRMGDEVTHIIIANADGSDLHEFFTLKREGAIIDIAWSPDGKRLALITDEDFGAASDQRRLSTISLADKSILPLGSKTWGTAISINWQSDGTSLLVIGDTGPARYRLWTVSYPEGEASKVTTDDVFNMRMSSISLDGSIALERVEFRTSLWSLDLQSGEASQLTAERVDQMGALGLDQMKDGSLLVTKLGSLWKLSGDGFRTETLLNPVAANDPVVSSDGRYILYGSRLNDGMAIWRMNEDGKDAVSLTKPGLKVDFQPVLLGDNRSVLFIRTTDGYETRLMKTTIDGGEEQEVLFTRNVRIAYISTSRDGNMISALTSAVDYNSPDGGLNSIRFFRSEGDQLIPVNRNPDLSLLGTPANSGVWTTDRSLITNGARDIANLYQEQQGKEKFAKLTDFKDGMIRRLILSRDGKQVFFVRSFRGSDIFLMKLSQFRTIGHE